MENRKDNPKTLWLSPQLMPSLQGKVVLLAFLPRSSRFYLLRLINEEGHKESPKVLITLYFISWAAQTQHSFYYFSVIYAKYFMLKIGGKGWKITSHSKSLSVKDL